MADSHLIPRAIPLRRGNLCIVSESLVSNPYLEGRKSAPFTFRSNRKRKFDDTGQDSGAPQRLNEDEGVSSIGTVVNFAQSVLSFGSKSSDEVCLSILDLRDPLPSRQIIRPGYSARRYISSWTKNVDDSLVKRWMTDGKLSENSVYQTNLFLPHIKKRWNDNLSNFPEPYRIVKQMLMAPGPLNEYSFFWSKKGAPESFETGDIQVFSESHGEVVNYQDLEKSHQKGILSTLLVKSALNYGLKQTENKDEAEENGDLMDAVRYLVDTDTAALKAKHRAQRMQLRQRRQKPVPSRFTGPSDLQLAGEHVGPDVQLSLPSTVLTESVEHLPEIHDAPLMSISVRVPYGIQEASRHGKLPDVNIFPSDAEAYNEEARDQLTELSTLQTSNEHFSSPMIFGNMPKARGVWGQHSKSTGLKRGLPSVNISSKEHNSPVLSLNEIRFIGERQDIKDLADMQGKPDDATASHFMTDTFNQTKKTDEIKLPRLRTPRREREIKPGDFNAGDFLHAEGVTPCATITNTPIDSPREQSATHRDERSMDINALDHESLVNALTTHAESVAERILEQDDAGKDIAMDIQRAIADVVTQRAKKEQEEAHIQQTEMETPFVDRSHETEVKMMIKTALINAVSGTCDSSDVLNSDDVEMPDEVVELLVSNSGVTPHDLVMLTNAETGKKVIVAQQWLNEIAEMNASEEIEEEEAMDIGEVSQMLNDDPETLNVMIADNDDLVMQMMLESPDKMQNFEQLEVLIRKQVDEINEDASEENREVKGSEDIRKFVQENPEKVLEMLKNDENALKELITSNRSQVADIIKSNPSKLVQAMESGTVKISKTVTSRRTKRQAKGKRKIITTKLGKKESEMPGIPSVSELKNSPLKLITFLKSNVASVRDLLLSVNPELVLPSKLAFSVNVETPLQVYLDNIENIKSLMMQSHDLLQQLIQLVYDQRQGKQRLFSEVSTISRQKSKSEMKIVQHPEEFRVGQVSRADDIKSLYSATQPGKVTSESAKGKKSDTRASHDIEQKVSTKKTTKKGRSKKTVVSAASRDASEKVKQPQQKKTEVKKQKTKKKVDEKSGGKIETEEETAFEIVDESSGDEDTEAEVEPATAVENVDDVTADQEEDLDEWQRKAEEELKKLSIKEQREAKRRLDAERRRRETDRRRREADQRRREEAAEAERRLEMEAEMEMERKRRDEEFRERRRLEMEERERQEKEIEEAEKRALLAKERENRERERFLKRMEEAKRMRAMEEEKRRQEELIQKAAEEARRREEEAMLAKMEVQARQEYLERKKAEEERIRREAEELRRKQEEEDAVALAEARRLAAELSKIREAEYNRRKFQRSLLEERAGHERYLGITPAFTFSYFDLLKWVGIDLPNAVKAQVKAM